MWRLHEGSPCSGVPRVTGHYLAGKQARDVVTGITTQAVFGFRYVPLFGESATDDYQRGRAIKQNGAPNHNSLFASRVAFNSKRGMLALGGGLQTCMRCLLDPSTERFASPKTVRTHCVLSNVNRLWHYYEVLGA